MTVLNNYAFKQISSSLKHRGATVEITTDCSKIEGVFTNHGNAMIAWHALGQKYGGDSEDMNEIFERYHVKPSRSVDLMTLTFSFKTK